MRTFASVSLALVAVAMPAASMAQQAPTDEPAPGATAIMNANYGAAVREIQKAPVSPYDPARSINLGVAFAKMGETAKAEREFREVLGEEDVQMVVANGGTYSSHEIALRALDALKSGVLSR
jgi:predicted dehydrogenase